MEQGKDEILGLQCVHSKAAETFFPNWDEHWIVNDLEDTDLSYRVFCNPDIRVQTFLDECRFLSAIQTDGHVTLLFTVGKRQKFPLCSKANCSKQTKCICFKQYKKLLEEYEQNDDDSNYYWDRRRRQKPGVSGRCCPMEKMKFGSQDKGWINSKLKKLHRLRNHEYNKRGRSMKYECLAKEFDINTKLKQRNIC